MVHTAATNCSKAPVFAASGRRFFTLVAPVHSRYGRRELVYFKFIYDWHDTFFTQHSCWVGEAISSATYTAGQVSSSADLARGGF